MSEITLDLRGLKCPLPVLRTRRALRRCPAGTVLWVSCTDPLASIDLPHLLHETGDTLVGQTLEEGVLVFRIEKAAPVTPATTPGDDAPRRGLPAD